MKKLIVASMLIIAIPYVANAAELKTQSNAPVIDGNIQGRDAKAGSSIKQIAAGPTNSYEVAALFSVLEKKGVISKEELSKEVQDLDLKQFSDPDPYTSIR